MCDLPSPELSVAVGGFSDLIEWAEWSSQFRQLDDGFWRETCRPKAVTQLPSNPLVKRFERLEVQECGDNRI
jgi:hypothetical protein